MPTSILRSLLASNKSFASIDLDSNNIETGGGTEIPDYLAKNPPLNSLYWKTATWMITISTLLREL